MCSKSLSLASRKQFINVGIVRMENDSLYQCIFQTILQNTIKHDRKNKNKAGNLLLLSKNIPIIITFNGDLKI